MNAFLVSVAVSATFLEKVKSECGYETCQTDLERVVSLREWAWANTTYCCGGKGALEIENRDFWCTEKDPEKLFEAMKHGPVMCGGAGTALYRLYQAFGFQAWGINVRVCPEFQHYLALVEIEDHGERIRVLQDPSWNIDFRAHDGTPIGLEVLQWTLENHWSNLIVVREGRVLKWPAVCLRGQSVSQAIKGCGAIDASHYRVLPPQPNGDVFIESPRTWTNWTEKKKSSLSMWLHDAGWPTDPVYFYAKTEAIYPEMKSGREP
jgi:hypothetical protein